MKKFSSFLFSATILTASLVLPAQVAAAADVPVVQTKTTTTTITATDPAVIETMVTTTVQYELPYPGLLPDSPLYFLKQLRDWLLDKLIIDPLKKAEFYILQADKRLAMGQMLLANGKGVLSETTISKGEKYMNNAVSSLMALKAQGKEIPAYLIDRLQKALAKHILVLESILSTVAESEKAGITASINLVKKLQADLETLKQ